MLQIIDPGNTLSAAQRDALTAKAHAFPFDIHVYIGTGSGQISETRANFEQEIAAHVKPGSRMVSIGVEPVRHWTFVRSSAALGVPAGPQVAQAGNAFFRSGNLVDGIDAIAAKANELRVEPRAPVPFVAGPDQKVIQSQTGVPIIIEEHHTSAGVWWGAGAFVAVAGAIVVYAVWRARKARLAARAAEEAATAEAAELAARNIEEAGWHNAMARTYRAGQAPTPLPASPRASVSPLKSPVGPARWTAPAGATVPRVTLDPPRPLPPPQTVVVQQPASSGLDMLIGYELGRDSNRPAPTPVIVEREVYVAPTPSPSYESSSSSDTSSSSSWSGPDDTSSSSSFDSSGGGGGGDTSSGSDWS